MELMDGRGLLIISIYVNGGTQKDCVLLFCAWNWKFCKLFFRGRVFLALFASFICIAKGNSFYQIRGTDRSFVD